MPQPSRLRNSTYEHIPYEYERRSLSLEEAKSYNYVSKSVDTFNGDELVTTKVMHFMSEKHYQTCMHNWNTMGERMSHTPSPDGKTFHWKYKETPVK